MDLSLAIVQRQALLGAPQVLLGEAVVAAYGGDTSGANRHIPAALRIEDSARLQDVMRIASRHQVPVYPISTGQNWGYGTALPAREGCVILDLSPLKKIIDFDEELGVVTLEPGVTQGMLADFLEAGNHPYLVPVTGAGPSCSLVGNALERGYGVTPHVDHFGAVTDLEANFSIRLNLAYATRAQAPERPRSTGRMNFNSNCWSGLEFPNGRQVNLSF